MNLALIGPKAGILSAGRPGVRKGQEGPGVPGRAQKRGSGSLVGPWQYQIRVYGWVGRGTTQPVYPPWYPPGIPPSRYHPSRTTLTTYSAVLNSQFRVDQGDPRGRIRTATLVYRSSSRTPHLTPAPSQPPLEPGAGCEAAARARVVQWLPASSIQYPVSSIQYPVSEPCP